MINIPFLQEAARAKTTTPPSCVVFELLPFGGKDVRRVSPVLLVIVCTYCTHKANSRVRCVAVLTFATNVGRRRELLSWLLRVSIPPLLS